MEFTLFSFSAAVICGAFLIAGIIDSICGGGGLITVPAFIALGLPTHLITGTNQCAALPGTFVSVYKYIKSGNVHYKSALLTIPFAIVGGYIGAKLNLLIPLSLLQNIMLVMVPVLVVVTLLNKGHDGKNVVDRYTNGQMLARTAAIGLIIGAYQGFYGPGGGMFFIMGFNMLLKLDLLRCAGNKSLVVIFSSVAAVITYAKSGAVMWTLAAICAIFYIVGSYIGSSLAIKNGQKIIRPIVLCVAIMLVIKIAFFR